MKKGLKRFLCGLLSASMILGNTMPIFAADNTRIENVLPQAESVAIETASADTASKSTLENIALGKNTVQSDCEGTKDSSRAVDGNTSTHWAGVSHSSWMYVDLGGNYEVDSINVLTYPTAKGRYYHYELLGSLDGASWTSIAVKNDNVADASAGNDYAVGGQVFRFIKLQFAYNSDNKAVHLKELRVYGTEAASGDVDVDPIDPNNIAYGKPTFATSNDADSVYVTDGILLTQWEGVDFPAHVDVDLEQYYELKDIVVYMTTASACTYRIYGSNDGVNFDRLAVQDEYVLADDNGKTFTLEGNPKYRIIRVNVTGNQAGQKASSIVREIKVHGTAVDEEAAPIRENIDLKSYDEWMLEKYGVDLSQMKDENGDYDIKETYTAADTYAEIDGIVERMLGAKYVDWFSYEIAANEKEGGEEDYFELSMKDGKVHIKGNEGVSITSGLNHYLKYYLNVHISQETKQVRMPEAPVVLTEAVYKDTPFGVRYAYNYCTLSYTMAFWGYDEWQRELDYLALCGANVVLDLTGTEGMFIHYLQKLGYSVEEAKGYVSGQSYKAWWLMGNLEGYGGPVTDQWVIDTVEMARINQRKMTVLGMEPVQQGFMGTLPTNIAEKANAHMTSLGYDALDASLVEQGEWSSYQRPILLRTDYNGYAYLAEEFYDSQEYIYGRTTKYYAGDLAHEGGVIPADLSKEAMALTILDQMKGFDEDAVWIIQSWGSNPKKELLQGFGQENRENHVIVLDLNANSDERWSNTSRWGGAEFGGTSWVYCMLDNYGGRPGVHGELETIAERILEARNTAQYMKGIGITPEGTEQNPVNYEILWEMVWQDEPLDVDEWLKGYITRRYGAYSDYLYEAWLKLAETAYGHNYVADGVSKVHQATANAVINLYPRFQPSVGLGHIEIDYDTVEFEKAVELFMADFDQYKDQETYIYDTVDFQRQLIANAQYEFFQRVVEAYATRDLATFNKYADKLLDGINLLDEIASYSKNSLTGRWIGMATGFMEDERTGEYDDFGKDMLETNARALISTWGARSWFTYCHRQYSGILKDFNYPMWKMWLDSLRTSLEGGEYKSLSAATDFFNIGWDFVLNGKEYTDTANAEVDGLKATYADIQANYGIEDARVEAETTDNISADGTAYAYSYSADSHSPDKVNDGAYSSYWWSNGRSVPTYAGLNFGKTRNVYGIKLIFETRYPLGNDIMPFTVESMESNTVVKETLASGQNYDADTESYVYTLFFDDVKEIENLRIYFSENSTLMYPAIGEMLVYEFEGLKARSASGMVVIGDKIYNLSSGKTVEELKAEFQVAKHNTILVFDAGGNELNHTDASDAAAKVQVVSPAGVVLGEYTVENTTYLVEELKALVETGKACNPENYSAGSYQAMQNVITDAEEILAKETASVAELSDGIEAVKVAMEELVDISLTKKAIAAIDGIDTSMYQEAYLENYQTNLDLAKAAMEDTDLTQEEAYKALDYARIAKKYLVSKDITNIASEGTAYADNYLNNFFLIEYMNDGDFKTMWANTTTEVPAQGGIVFSEGKAVSGIRLYLEDNAYRYTTMNFVVEVKEAGNADYTVVYENTCGVENGYDFEILFEEDKVIDDIKVTFTSYSSVELPRPGIMEILVYQGEKEVETTVELPTKDSVKIATYNIAAIKQPTQATMTAILNQLKNNDIDIAGLQEIDVFTSRNNYDMLKFFQGETYQDIHYRKSIDYGGGAYGIGTISKNVILEETSGSLTTPSGSEQRSWQRSLVEVDGKQIAFYNTHLALTVPVIKTQIQELLAMMEADPAEYVVLVGDFNISDGHYLLYPFLKNYNLANGKDGVWYDSFNAENPVETTNYAIDNIITSRNINVKSVNHVDNSLSDHDMLWIECELLDEEVVSTQYLDILLEEARTIDGSKYFEDTYAPLADALAAADALTETSTQEEVNAVADALDAGLEGLVAQPAMDENIALGKSVLSTSPRLTDGSTSSYDSIGVYPASFEIDLGEVYAVEKMVAFPYVQGDRYYNYYIEVSEDGDTYTKVAEKTDTTPEVAEGTPYEFEEAVNARYVRVTMTYNNQNTVTHMREFEVYAKDAGTGELVNVASGKHSVYLGGKNITDGSLDSYWDGRKYPGYFIIDLERVYTLGKFVAFPYVGSGRYYNYEIAVSVDGKEYTKVAEKTDTTPEVAAGTTYELEKAVDARYVKVTMLYNNNNSSIHMREFEVYQGEKAEPVKLEIVKQPVDAAAKKGEMAEVTVEAVGEGLTYTWYYKNPGNKKFYLSGTDFVSEDGATYSIPMYAWRDGQEVYCEITDAYGDVVQSNVVTLTMDTGTIKIVKQPESVVVASAGDTAVVTVEATGEGLTYEWYYKNPGNKKFYVSGEQFVSEDGASYSIPVKAWRDGEEVYCVITDVNGDSVQTNTVTLSIAK